MQPYKNTNEGIESYETGDDFIRIKFSTPSRSGGTLYKYSYASAGKDNIERMKQLAEAGEGLSPFITANTRKSYETKE
jgi:hypothetical protein